MTKVMDTHSAAVFSRFDHVTGKIVWLLTFKKTGLRGNPAEATNLYWKPGQSTWTDAAECELFCAIIRNQRQVSIHAHRIVDVMHFLERIEGASVSGGYVPVHADPEHYRLADMAAGTR